jgi:hypothetical protein
LSARTQPKNSGRPRGDHNFCKNERNKEKPQATGVNTGLLRFLMGGTCDGEGKPITTRQLIITTPNSTRALLALPWGAFFFAC